MCVRAAQIRWPGQVESTTVLW